METRETTSRVYECLEVCVHMGRYHDIPIPRTRSQDGNEWIVTWVDRTSQSPRMETNGL